MSVHVDAVYLRHRLIDHPVPDSALIGYGEHVVFDAPSTMERRTLVRVPAGCEAPSRCQSDTASASEVRHAE